jgi:hypothetical protein
MNTITVKDGYDKRKSAEPVTVRPMTFEEACNISHDHVEFIGRQGDLRRCKVNGAVRRWKRDLTRIEIPVKYGMYEYTTFSLRSDGLIGNDCAYLVVRV